MKTQTDNYYKEFLLLLGKSIIFIILTALLLVGCNSSNAAPSAAAPSTLPVMNIASTTATTDAEYPAAIQGTTDIEIRPQVSGTLDQVFVDGGAYVTNGQPLFKINDNPNL